MRLQACSRAYCGVFGRLTAGKDETRHNEMWCVCVCVCVISFVTPQSCDTVFVIHGKGQNVSVWWVSSVGCGGWNRTTNVHVSMVQACLFGFMVIA